MADIVIIDGNGDPTTYYNVKEVVLDTPIEEVYAHFQEGEIAEDVEVDCDFSNGDMDVNAPSGTLIKELVVKKPTNLIAANVKKDVVIAGVTGSMVGGTSIIDGTAVEIETDATHIKDYCFYQSLLLKKLIAPNAISIGNHAFYSCSSLETVDIRNVESVGNYGFYNCYKLYLNGGTLTVPNIGDYGLAQAGLNGSGFIYSPSEPATLGSNAFRQSRLLKAEGEFKSINGSAFYNISYITEFNGIVNGPIGTYAFYGCQKIGTCDFSSSNITDIGTQAFYYFGYSRANSGIKLVLDFRGSSFTVINSYCFAYTRYTDFFIPTTVNSIQNYAFRYSASGTNIYFTSDSPAVLTSVAFDGINSPYKLLVPYKNANAYRSAQYWSNYSSNILAWSSENEFETGQTLPSYNKEGYALTWYSDIDMLSQITVCPSGNSILYSTVGSTKDKLVVSTAVINATLIVKDQNNTPVDTRNGYFVCDSGDSFSVDVSIESGWNFVVMIDETVIQSFPYSFTVTSDSAINVIGYQGSYIPISYLESSGIQWVDTGVVFSSEVSKIDFKYAPTVAKSGYGYALGSWTGSQRSPIYACMNSTRTCVAAGSTSERGNSVTYTTYAIREVHITTSSDKRFDIDDNGTTYYFYYSGTIVTTGYPLYLFATNYRGDTALTTSNSWSIRLYYCKIYDNGTLVRDYIPVLRASDMKPGLLDKEHMQFYPNAGSGEFTYAY